MKLIIDIPEHDKNVIERFVRGDGCEDMPPSIIENLIRAIYFATPLEKHDEEVIKETVASVWGKPPYTELLDSIKTEIEECKRYRGLTGNPIIDKHNVGLDKYYDLGLEKAIKIIDKYRKGDKE